MNGVRTHRNSRNNAVSARLYSPPIFCENPPFVSFQANLNPTLHIESARNLMGSDRAGANKKRREKRNLKNIKTQEKKQAAAAK